MKKILVIALICFVHNTYAQNTEQMRMAYYLNHKDSISALFIRLIFQAKNEDGEMLEGFAKRKLGKKYDEYFQLNSKNELDIDKIKSLIKKPKFYNLVIQVNRDFFKDKNFRKTFIRTWNNTHSIINELVCTKKEYDKLVENTLIKSELYFTLLVSPLIKMSFDIE